MRLPPTAGLPAGPSAVEPCLQPANASCAAASPMAHLPPARSKLRHPLPPPPARRRPQGLPRILQIRAGAGPAPAGGALRLLPLHTPLLLPAGHAAPTGPALPRHLHRKPHKRWHRQDAFCRVPGPPLCVRAQDANYGPAGEPVHGRQCRQPLQAGRGGAQPRPASRQPRLCLPSSSLLSASRSLSPTLTPRRPTPRRPPAWRPTPRSAAAAQ